MSVVEVVDGGQALRARRIFKLNGLGAIACAVVELMVAIFRLLSSDLPQVIENTPKVEQFRARQRRMLRKN
ncbi:hypothetical protein PF005_g29122 [Phytophthora fragariae]|uniref:Uncharacterized protein n=1 Tax=Phytophthora fragariae TaxID=53985 RepID=A0A6A3VFQ0_9STRA|nr:hypothetical protein PF005_g29122 [Phytophthora fragariae]